MVLMGEGFGVVQRQGRGCRGRVVVVWLARLSWRCVVSWIPLVPWRHSFSSRVLLRVVDRAAHDRVAEHGSSGAHSEGNGRRRLLHGRPAADAGRGRAQRECAGEAATRWMRRARRGPTVVVGRLLAKRTADGDGGRAEARWEWDAGWCGATLLKSLPPRLARQLLLSAPAAVCCSNQAPAVMQSRDEVGCSARDQQMHAKYAQAMARPSLMGSKSRAFTPITRGLPFATGSANCAALYRPKHLNPISR